MYGIGRRRTAVFASFVALLLICFGNAQAEVKKSTADHSKFKELQQDFKTGPEVTEACLSCHTEASKQLMQTTHWTWEFDHPKTGEKLGKRNVLNSFCGNVVSNEPRCTSCHIGYGWQDMNVSSSEALGEQQVDCLVCHDKTGTYSKFPTKAGHPLYEPTNVNGKVQMPPDLTKIAQHVGQTSRENCGACHFYGGGGDGVKHGDLDSSLTNPPKSLDVHMSKEGANMTCATCHNPDAHNVPGSRYATKVIDKEGVDIPTSHYKDHASCDSCHGDKPHKTKEKLNDHTDKVACQTCHIPEFARGGVATKTWWDWSTAGKMDENGNPLNIKDDHGHITYMATKGDFKYAENVVPTYAWFDGQMNYTLRDEEINDQGVVAMNTFGGSANDPQSRIWPFKLMRGKQPYDTKEKHLLINHVFGKDDASFWSNFSWEKALKFGTQKAGQSYSGEFGFVETTMHWPITHMVAPKEDALSCQDCHTRTNSRLAAITDVYMPGRDHFPLLSSIGWGLALLTLVGSIGHGLIRLISTKRGGR
ncbi:tetrathionate reductase family octaheme c-type cytochrome [Terasakiella pusilla]|uniref:tetrathionate reductase family octaheme c-type cytochrome n=1 Tax=Terasakiella pusilla TaxID=64973 RepID=UPI003AA94032